MSNIAELLFLWDFSYLFFIYLFHRCLVFSARNYFFFVFCYFRLFYRLREVPIFPLEFVEPPNDIANAGARKPRRGKTREATIFLAYRIFLASGPLLFLLLGFRAPAFAMSFRGSTNSREKLGTAGSLLFYTYINFQHHPISLTLLVTSSTKPPPPSILKTKI